MTGVGGERTGGEQSQCFSGGRENREPSEIAAVAQRNVLSITLGRDQDCVFLSIFFKKYALKEYRDQREKQEKFPPSKKRGGKV